MVTELTAVRRRGQVITYFILLLQIAKEQKVRISELLSAHQEITEQLEGKASKLESECKALQSSKAKLTTLKEVRRRGRGRRNVLCIAGEQ